MSVASRPREVVAGIPIRCAVFFNFQTTDANVPGHVARKGMLKGGVVRKNDIWQLSSCSLERIFMVKAAQYRR